MYLMRRGWLFCPSFFLSSLFNAKIPFSTFGLCRAPFNSAPRLFEVGGLPRCLGQLWSFNLYTNQGSTFWGHPTNIPRGLPPRKCLHPFYQPFRVFVPPHIYFDNSIVTTKGWYLNSGSLRKIKRCQQIELQYSWHIYV